MRTLIPSVLFLLATTATANAGPGRLRHHAKAMQQRLELRSDAFTNGGAIPAQYTCDGESSAPQLSWSRAPEGTKSLAVLVEDPDAPGGHFTHLLVTGLPPDTRSLDADRLPGGAQALANGNGGDGWAAPCPPSGQHRYVFRVYALDIPIDRRLNKDDFMRAIDGHVIAQGQLSGHYKRAKAMRRPDRDRTDRNDRNDRNDHNDRVRTY